MTDPKIIVLHPNWSRAVERADSIDWLTGRHNTITLSLFARRGDDTPPTPAAPALPIPACHIIEARAA